MAATNKWDGFGPPSAAATEAGSSRTGPFLNSGPPCDGAVGTADGSTESTGLLGAGTRSRDGDHDGREERWEGFEDFEGLPWWKRPSVRCMLQLSDASR